MVSAAWSIFSPARSIGPFFAHAAMLSATAQISSGNKALVDVMSRPLKGVFDRSPPLFSRPAASRQSSDMTPERSLRILLWLVATGFFMQTLDTTIVNTALPAMAASLGEKPLRMQSVVIAYALTMAM